MSPGLKCWKFTTGLFFIFKETAVEWVKRDAPRRAASVAFFATFTLAPLLVVIMGIFGLIMSREVMRETLLEDITNLVGPQAAEMADKLLTNMTHHGRGLRSTIIGLAVSLFAATTVFAQLQYHMNKLWEVSPKPGKGILFYLRARALSVVFIIVLCLLLLCSLLIDAALVGFRDALSNWLPVKIALVHWGNVSLWFLISVLLFASMFKFMPNIRIRWRDVLPAALITALLFGAGRQLVGLYLSKSAAVTAYGAAGALAIILFWVYYSCMVFLFGVLFCRTTTKHLKSPVSAKSYAVHES